MNTPQIAIVCTALLTLTALGCKNDQTPNSSLNEVTVHGGSIANIGVEITPTGSTNHAFAKFYYNEQGQKHFYTEMQDEPIRAERLLGYVSLTYLGTEVGRLFEDKLYICDSYNLPGGKVNFPCNATFYNPEFNAAFVPVSERSRVNAGYTMDISLGEPDTVGAALTQSGERITLENYAQNQINQYGTSTCAYNAATGIIEILYAMNSGKAENFSEPYYLANAPRFGAQTSWFWTMYERFDSETTAMVRNADLPVTAIYRSGVGFGSAQTRAESYFRSNGGEKHKLPFTMKGEKLFFHADWKGGYMQGKNRPSEDDYRNAVRWFQTNKKPINVHYWINNIWHSVIMIGYDPSSDSILIKDSLGNTHLKGTWKSKKWFLKYGYAAIGVHDGKQSTQTGSDNTVTDTGVSVPPVSSDDSIDWTQRFKVKLHLGGWSGRHREFGLSLVASDEDLARVEQVTYMIHPTFGSQAEKTITDSTSLFRLSKYWTYARGWRTTGTKVRIKLNGGTKEVTLPGTLISW